MKVSKLGRYHCARVEWIVQSSEEGLEESFAAREPVGARRSSRRVLRPGSSGVVGEM